MLFNQKKKKGRAAPPRRVAPWRAAGAKIWVPARSAGPPPQPLGAAAGENFFSKNFQKFFF